MAKLKGFHCPFHDYSCTGQLTVLHTLITVLLVIVITKREKGYGSLRSTFKKGYRDGFFLKLHPAPDQSPEQSVPEKKGYHSVTKSSKPLLGTSLRPRPLYLTGSTIGGSSPVL